MSTGEDAEDVSEGQSKCYSGDDDEDYDPAKDHSVNRFSKVKKSATSSKKPAKNKVCFNFDFFLLKLYSFWFQSF